jgi:hypothetical protein
VSSDLPRVYNKNCDVPLALQTLYTHIQEVDMYKVAPSLCIYSSLTHLFCFDILELRANLISVRNCLYSALNFNPLNHELNLICHLLALLEAHPILHVSKIRVKNCASYIYDGRTATLQMLPFIYFFNNYKY